MMNKEDMNVRRDNPIDALRASMKSGVKGSSGRAKKAPVGKMF